MSLEVQPFQLNHYFTDKSLEIAAASERSARLQSVAKNICYIALIAIFTVVLAAPMGLIPISPFTFVALILVSPIFTIFAGVFAQKQKNLSSIATEERGAANHMAALSEWTENDVKAFLETQKISLEQLPLDALRSINPEKPLLALIPGIARFHYLQVEMLKSELTVERNSKEGSALRLIGQGIAHEELEKKLIPTALKAATMLQILQYPTQKLIFLPLIGGAQCKTLEARLAGRHLEPKNDDYFIFVKKERPPLQLGEIIEVDLEPRDLRLKLFA